MKIELNRVGLLELIRLKFLHAALATVGQIGTSRHTDELCFCTGKEKARNR
jgi:hypothetical protein